MSQSKTDRELVRFARRFLPPDHVVELTKTRGCHLRLTMTGPHGSRFMSLASTPQSLGDLQRHVRQWIQRTVKEMSDG